MVKVVVEVMVAVQVVAVVGVGGRAAVSTAAVEN